MKDIAPLIQTILWVGLIGTIVWRYHKQIHALLETIQRRIESGSGIKAGPFEIPPELQPQNPAEQKNRVIHEIEEMVEATKEDDSKTSPALPPREDLLTRYFQAEDLALRAIQAEYGIPISRQLRVGKYMLDGFFVKDSKGHIIDVKYSRLPYSIHQIQKTAGEIFAAIGRYGWRNVKVTVAVVYDDNSIDLVKEEERLLESLQTLGKDADVRCFSLQQLEQQFGMLP